MRTLLAIKAKKITKNDLLLISLYILGNHTILGINKNEFQNLMLVIPELNKKTSTMNNSRKVQSIHLLIEKM